MSGFFKKALEFFVEFEPETPETDKISPTIPNTIKPSQIIQNIEKTVSNIPNTPAASIKLNETDIEKFASHFEKLFIDANLDGPDYFEFCKMMETLEAHIPDEKTRIQAVYTSLSIQGLTKQKLIESLSHYQNIVEKDQANFTNVLSKKSNIEIDSRKDLILQNEKKINDNAAIIQKLTQEITALQNTITELKLALEAEQQKLSQNALGYQSACTAMLNKIKSDLTQIQNSI